MIECKECGSEITEDEGFCPFCGINLNSPVAVEQKIKEPETEDSDEVESTEPEADDLSESAADEQKTELETDAETDSEEDTESEDEDVFFSISNLKSEKEIIIETPEAKPAQEVLVQEDEILTTSALQDEDDEDNAAPDESKEDEVSEEAEQGFEETDVEDSAEIESSINAAEAEEIEDNMLLQDDHEAEEEVDTPDVQGVSEAVSEMQTEVNVDFAAKDEAPPSFTETTEEKSQKIEPNDEDLGFAATVPDTPVEIGEMDLSASNDSETQKDERDEEIPDVLKASEATETPAQSAEETPQKTEMEDVQVEEDEISLDVSESEDVDGKEPSTAVADEAEPELPQVESEEPSYTHQNIGAEDTDGSKKTKLKPLSEGTFLNGRYEIVRKIGGGGMGAVYLANDKNLGGVLRAVKEMVQSYIEEEQQEKAINDFKRESMLLTTLEHSSIPTIYDYFYDEKESRFYLVMKYISGGDLAGQLRASPNGKLEERTVVEWGIEIADVLDYLHNHEPPIVYRDLKPSNIMLDGNTGRVMLIDFGIARWVNKEEKGVTAVGTMGYAPPELFSGNVEPRSDIYSLGSTMFHLLTGADPQSNPLLIFDFEKNPRPRQINSALSDQIEQILMQAVEYNSEGRFGSAAEMRDALTDHLRNLIHGKITYGVKATPEAVPLANQQVFCGFCGQKIVATDMFCAFCGAKQPLAQPGVHSQQYTPAMTTAKLYIKGTSELNAPSFELEKQENLLGRRDPISNIFPEVDLSKFDPQTKISRKHARIWREGDSFMLEDLGSSNGTILRSPVNGEILLKPRNAQILTNGDEIQMGDTTLHFVVN